MNLVIITAFGVGGATVVGALLGFLFKRIPHKWNDAVLGFAAGIMLAAAILGLIIPSAESVGKSGLWITAVEILTLQNIPEGMVIISPMLLSGVSKKRTLLIATLTGLIEVVGTFVGYFAATISSTILPFALAFAGGTMLYVISDEMIPETHSHGYERMATYSILIGFIFMLFMDTFIG